MQMSHFLVREAYASSPFSLIACIGLELPRDQRAAQGEYLYPPDILLLL
jgi:hypothetical protein